MSHELWQTSHAYFKHLRYIRAADGPAPVIPMQENTANIPKHLRSLYKQLLRNLPSLTTVNDQMLYQPLYTWARAMTTSLFNTYKVFGYNLDAFKLMDEWSLYEHIHVCGKIPTIIPNKWVIHEKQSQRFITLIYGSVIPSMVFVVQDKKATSERVLVISLKTPIMKNFIQYYVKTRTENDPSREWATNIYQISTNTLGIGSYHEISSFLNSISQTFFIP